MQLERRGVRGGEGGGRWWERAEGWRVEQGERGEGQDAQGWRSWLRMPLVLQLPQLLLLLLRLLLQL